MRTKGKYLSSFAEQSFATSPAGDRLFFRFGLFSKPYIVPNAQVEEELLQRQRLMYYLVFFAILLGKPISTHVLSDVAGNPGMMIAFIAILAVLTTIVSNLVFSKLLNKLHQTDSRMPFVYVQTMANKHKVSTMVLYLIAALLLVGCSIWVMLAGKELFIAILTAGASGLCFAIWGYALYLKLQINND